MVPKSVLMPRKLTIEKLEKLPYVRLGVTFCTSSRLEMP